MLRRQSIFRLEFSIRWFSVSLIRALVTVCRIFSELLHHRIQLPWPNFCVFLCLNRIRKYEFSSPNWKRMRDSVTLTQLDCIIIFFAGRSGEYWMSFILHFSSGRIEFLYSIIFDWQNWSFAHCHPHQREIEHLILFKSIESRANGWNPNFLGAKSL